MTSARRLYAAAAALCCAALALTSCGSAGSSRGASVAQTAAHTSPQAPSRTAPQPAARQSRGVTKMVVLVVENHSLDQMRSGMPWVYRLAKRYGYASDYRAVTHPSLPNYLAMAGGTTYGVRDDASPSAHPLPGHSVFGRALAAGSTAKVYADAMPGSCYPAPAGRYAVKHNPWAYFPAERAACARHDVPLRRLAVDVRTGRLPAVGMVVPDLCHDAHDCSLSTANAWLRGQVGGMMRGPDWRSGRLAIVITADEDDNHHGNRVLTVVAHPGVSHRVVRTRLTHYSLSRSYAEVGDFVPLHHARGARSLLRAFGLHAS